MPVAKKEWNKLGSIIQRQFAKKLQERLKYPQIPSAALRNLLNHYKIKLRQSGYRLVYRVKDETVTVTVVSVGKRERGDVYKMAENRLHEVNVPVLGKS